MNVMQFTDSINKIYGQAVVKWDVYLEDKISFDYSFSDNETTFDAFRLVKFCILPILPKARRVML